MNIRELAEHYTEVKDFLYDIMLINKSNEVEYEIRL